MALDPKMLKKFLDNPAQFSAEDMGIDQGNGEQVAPDEGGAEAALDVPEIDPEAMLEQESPEIADPDELNQENDLEQDEEDSEMDIPQVSKKNLMEDASEEETQDIAGDMKAPMELRKQALMRIKQKYLGQ